MYFASQEATTANMGGTGDQQQQPSSLFGFANGNMENPSAFTFASSSSSAPASEPSPFQNTGAFFNRRQTFQESNCSDYARSIGQEYMEATHNTIRVNSEAKKVQKREKDLFDQLTTQLAHENIYRFTLPDKTVIEYRADPEPKKVRPSYTTLMKNLVGTNQITIHDKTCQLERLTEWVTDKTDQYSILETKPPSFYHKPPSLQVVMAYEHRRRQMEYQQGQAPQGFSNGM